MQIAITLTIPAILANPYTVPAVGAVIAVAGAVYIGRKIYKSVKQFKKITVENNGNDGEVDTPAKVAKSYIKHKIRMGVGMMPTWLFFVTGQATNAATWNLIRNKVNQQHFLIALPVHIISHIAEFIGVMGVNAATAYQPLAREYRLRYKQDIVRLANLENVSVC